MDVTIKEIWENVPGYDGLYEVSNLGRVRSLPRETTSGKILSPAIDKDGYERVCLCKNNRKKNIRVNRIVATVFLKNENSYPVVNHKDENKRNNRSENLEWCTVKYNTNYGTSLKRRSESRKRKVAQFDKNGNLVKIHDGVCDAAMSVNAKSHSNIASCCRGKRKTTSGYIWRYLEGME